MLNLKIFLKKISNQNIILLITLLIFINPVWNFSVLFDKCGGCCASWSGSCDFSLGFPLPYYSQGENIFNGYVHNFSLVNVIIDLIIWVFLFIKFRKK